MRILFFTLRTLFKLTPMPIRVRLLAFWSSKIYPPLPIYGVADLVLAEDGATLRRIVTNSENTRQMKRALLSYITTPFYLHPDNLPNVYFTNDGIAQSIVRALNELGYIVDIVEYTDRKFVPGKRYDLFIGHGGFNYKRIVRRLPPDVVKIYFSAGTYWKYWNEQELARFSFLRSRRGIKLPPERLDVSEEWAISHADAIIALGNDFLRGTYSNFPYVYTLNNAAYQDDHYNKQSKNFTSARNQFLFFAGGGNVHKGLDILLDAFKHVNAHLYICQNISPKFYKAYQRELEELPNIHLIGRIPLKSRQFYELVDKCCFVIAPSCADASPGAIVECMHQGLIPVLSRGVSIDTGDYGIMLETCSIDEIVKVVNDLSQQPAEWCEETSRRTRKAAVTEFSATAFLRNMKKSIQAVADRES